MGTVYLTKVNQNNSITHVSHNLVVTGGLEHIAERMLETPSQDAVKYIAVGTSNTGEIAGDTSLGNEISRKLISSVNRLGTTLVYSASWAAGELNGYTLEEAGLFNAATAGVMLARVTFGSVVMGPGDGYNITWEITIDLV